MSSRDGNKTPTPDFHDQNLPSSNKLKKLGRLPPPGLVVIELFTDVDVTVKAVSCQDVRKSCGGCRRMSREVWTRHLQLPVAFPWIEDTFAGASCANGDGVTGIVATGRIRARAKVRMYDIRNAIVGRLCLLYVREWIGVYDDQRRLETKSQA